MIKYFLFIFAPKIPVASTGILSDCSTFKQ